MQLTLAAVLVGRALLDRAVDRQWLQDVCRRTGLKSGVVHPILRRMHNEGWLADEWDGDATGPPARRYYHLTTPGLNELERFLARARGDGRFTHLFPKPPAPTFQTPRSDAAGGAR